ncbi:SpaH/EbpB family LPXTG-anchored major pilin [Gemmiger formicilis]|jgi:fimbrial isopeptide formation D2 family protein/LPXTG-motif cell wall-anchored protein|uniref:SpaH/EbpB family LPXTG-anchored major pilin n=1 Tax=Gemmiger formicilis TaxID=745368 RepID=UPI00241F3C4E|nr:SpaH/EbpB family LPXTG-anchored major pilin [Gemmiger formicilis]
MKLKRLFTAALSAVLALSLCAMPAMAEDGSTTTAGTPKTSTSTIDIGQKGSITIYKRALDGTVSGTAGDGETMTAPGTALKDTGFTLYQVMNTEALLAYYNGLSTGAEPEITVESCFKDKTSYTKENLKDTIHLAREEEFTNEAEGKVVFNELPVGLYLVIETTSPAAVTQKVEPFLVSIPMTRIGADASEMVNKNQESWLYDVTVYPKNSIAKGNVTLEKKGVTGANAESLEGVTFELYKKNDRNNDSTQLGYTKTETLSTGPNGTITFANLTKGSYYLKETGYTSGNDKGYILNTDGKFAFDVDDKGHVVASTDDTLTGKVEDGSFVISEDKTAPVQLTVYNYRPDIEKTVTKRNNDKAHQADYGVGDAVPYTLTIDVPKNITSLRTFKVTDTTVASQLVQKEDSVKVSGTGAIERTAYEVTVKEDANKNSVMTVAFKPGELAAVAGGKITITYTATVQATAAVAGNGNVNTAKIIYSRKTGTETEGKDPYEITDKGVVYTFDLNIHKTGEGGAEGKKNLKGVTFDLYKKVENYELDAGKVATTIKGTKYDDSNLCADAVKLGLTTNSTEKWIKIKVDTLQTDADGNASVKGLPSGTYKLVETKTVDGYNLLSKPVDAKLNLAYSEAWQTTTTYTDGNLTKSTIKTPTYTRDKATVADPNNEKVEIVNRAGFTLPVTGGFGTLLFSGIGVLLVLAGVGVLFSLKKKSNRA